ncbi:MAG: porin family protein [Proteobacteria bacterium]|nr:porin family protein [Pseudomonadota bacterium]
MNITLKAGLASALAVAACFLLPAASNAADLYGGGSLKDGYAPMPSVAPSIAGPCYMRGDVGYSWSGSGNSRYVGNAVTEQFSNESYGGGAMYDVAFGCGSGSRGFRAEIEFGYRPDRQFTGDNIITISGTPIDPKFTSKYDNYTVMANAYYDFGNFRGFVPYVGAGLGVSINDMGWTTTDSPLSPNPQFGQTKASLAWSLMAGVGYQLSDRAILDVGYRYIDLGKAQSDAQDTLMFKNPILALNDLSAHEVRVGLRYHFGASGSEAAYAPMK